MQSILLLLRKSKGLSRRQVASILKVSVETISSLEGGLLSRIAAFYNITIEALLIESSQNNEQIELLKLYNALDDHSKGELFERASYLAAKSSK